MAPSTSAQRASSCSVAPTRSGTFTTGKTMAMARGAITSSLTTLPFSAQGAFTTTPQRTRSTQITSSASRSSPLPLSRFLLACRLAAHRSSVARSRSLRTIGRPRWCQCTCSIAIGRAATTTRRVASLLSTTSVTRVATLFAWESHLSSSTTSDSSGFPSLPWGISFTNTPPTSAPTRATLARRLILRRAHSCVAIGSSQCRRAMQWRLGPLRADSASTTSSHRRGSSWRGSSMASMSRGTHASTRRSRSASARTIWRGSRLARRHYRRRSAWSKTRALASWPLWAA
mmetsp:Transcript_128582/g.274245  ORF Transcript_128582/g.274245 Transcript_128582/m.274245 type:complete len:287 (+) Transcript_128582:481-1341(+)